MPPIQRALDEIRALRDELAPSPEPGPAGPVAEAPPPGTDPVTYALEEVARLRRAVQQIRSERLPDRPVPWVPRASVYAGDRESMVVLEIPGVVREDVSVSLSGHELVVRGERRPATAGEELTPVVVEQSSGPFERRFAVPSWCTPERISARCTHGLLLIGMSRGGEATRPDLEIEVG
jgi:HSP20 family protein